MFMMTISEVVRYSLCLMRVLLLIASGCKTEMRSSGIGGDNEEIEWSEDVRKWIEDEDRTLKEDADGLGNAPSDDSGAL